MISKGSLSILRLLFMDYLGGDRATALSYAAKLSTVTF